MVRSGTVQPSSGRCVWRLLSHVVSVWFAWTPGKEFRLLSRQADQRKIKAMEVSLTAEVWFLVRRLTHFIASQIEVDVNQNLWYGYGCLSPEFRDSSMRERRL